MLIYNAYVPRGVFFSLVFISYHALNTSSYTPSIAHMTATIDDDIRK
jgi:hypothetical protein